MLAAIALMAATSAVPVGLKVGPNGVLELSARGRPLARVYPGVHGPNWEYSSLATGEHVVSRGEGELRAELPVGGTAARLKLREAWQRIGEEVRVSLRGQFTAAAKINGAYLLVCLPVEEFIGQPMVVLPSGDEVKLPEDPAGPRWSGVAVAIMVRRRDGLWLCLLPWSPRWVGLEDLRRFGSQTYELRFHLARKRVGAGQQCAMTLSIAAGSRAEVERLAKKGVAGVALDPSRPYAAVDMLFPRVTLGMGWEQIGELRLGVHGPGWKYATDDSGSWTREAVGPGKRLFAGSVPVPGNAEGADLRARAEFEAADGRLVMRWRFSFPRPVRLNSYQVSLNLPVEQWAGGQVELRGEDGAGVVKLPEAYGETMLGQRRAGEVRIVRSGMPELRIEVKPPLLVLVQDNREWGSRIYEVRLNLLRDGAGREIAGGTEREVEIALSSAPALQPVLYADAASFQYDHSKWVAYTLPWDEAPVDLSFLNDKPAGKHGFLTVRDGRFVFEDGTPARFWGTCFSAGANFPTHEQAEKIARRLARFGINVVRVHHADAYWAERCFFRKGADNTREFDPESLDRFDYLVYCLKREGIYVYLDLLVNRKFKPGDGADAADKLPVAGKPYSNFDPRLIELQQEYARKLYEHRNPYTGLAYKDDPAIILSEFANENDLFSQPVELEPYRSRLEEMFRQWARERGITLPGGKIDFTQRTDAIMAFFVDVQRRFYDDMRRFLREVVGVRVPLTGSNWSRNAALLAALEVCDYTDSHAYWHHPDRDGRVGNTPAVRAFSPMASTLAFNRLAGKPFFVSEWNEPWPNEWRAEMPIIMAAVGALQGWDGLTVYTYAHTSQRMPQIDYLSGHFETFNDPAIFGLMPAAALMFRRGDVQPARERWVVVVPEEQIAAASSLAPWTCQALKGTVFVHRVEMALRRAPAGADRVLRPSDRPFGREAGRLVSDTGQIVHDWQRGLFLVDTERTKVACGFLGAAGTIELGRVRIRCSNEFAVIAVSSLDGRPLEASRRILITAVAKAENSGTRWDVTRRRLLSRGRGPIMVEPVEGRVELQSAAGLRAYALAPDGKQRAWKCRRAGRRVVVPIGREARTIYYLLER